MNEKINLNLIIILFLVSFVFGGAVGFFIGRGDIVGFTGLKPSNRELAETVGELGAELDRERAIVERIRSEQEEERAIIRTAIDSCGRTGEGLQGVIKKMEILNGLIFDLERRAFGSVDISEIK